MNRRTFFRWIAATVAGAVAVGVAPRVVAAKRPGIDKARQMGMNLPIKLWPIQRKIILDMQDEFDTIPINQLHKELDEYACTDYFWMNQLFSNENQNPKTR